MDFRARLRRMWSLSSGSHSIALIATLRGSGEHMRGVVWQPFVLSLGIPMSSLGGLESTYDVTRISVQPVFGSISDAIGRKRFLVLRELLLISAMVLYIVANSWTFLIAGVAIVGLSYAVEPVWTTFVAESSPKRGLGMAYSVVNTAFMAAGLFAPVTAGLLAASFGYTSVYWVVAALGLFTIAFILIRLPESNDKEGRGTLTWHKLVEAFQKVVRPPRRLRGFYLSMAVDGIAFSLGTRLLYGMLTKSQGYTPYMLSLLATSLTVAWAIVQIPFGRLVDKLGYRRSLAISQTMSCFYLAAMLMTQRFEIVLVLQALIGVSAALWVPAEQAWIASNVEPERRGEYLGSYLAFKGLVAIPAPFIGGALFDAFGFSAPMTINLVGAIVDVILIATMVNDTVKSPLAAPSLL